MMQFLLIFVLYLPATGQYQEQVGAFPTEAECQKTLREVRASVRPTPGVSFALVCTRARPSDATDT